MQRRLPLPLLLLLLLLLLLCAPAPASGRVARVAAGGGGGSTLLAALAAADVTRIELATNYSVAGGEFEQLVAQPLKITRNLTLTSAAAPAASQRGAPPVLDLAASLAVVELCSSCTLRLENLTTAAEVVRHSRSNVLAFVRGRPGSRIDVRDYTSLRRVCSTTQSSLANLLTTPRSPLFPGASEPQRATAVNVSYAGRPFPNSLHVDDVTYDVPLTLMERNNYLGGVAVHRRNATRLCERFISSECAQTRGPDVCIAELEDALDAAAAGHSGSGSGGDSAAMAAAIAVPVSVIGALLLTGGVFAQWRLRRCRRRRTALLAKPGGGAGPGAAVAVDAAVGIRGGLLPPHDASSRQGSPLGVAAARPGASSGSSTGRRGTDSALPSLAPAATDAHCWEVVATQFAPSMQHASGSAIELGEVIGAGSFARVLRGRWAGMDVAVKVIEHDEAALATVQNEAELMLGLGAHPNLVQAYHVITYARKALPQSPTAAAGGGGGTAAAGSTPQLLDSQLQRASGTPASSVLLPSTPAPRGDAVRTSSLALSSMASLTSAARSSEQLAGQAASMGQVASSSQAASTGQAWAVIQDAAPVVAVDAKPATVPRRYETYIVQELCDCTLAAEVSAWRLGLGLQPEQPLPPDDEDLMLRRLLLLSDCARGLQVLHARGIVHGDLNSYNVLVTRGRTGASRPQLCAKLSDLGISRLLRHATHTHTRTTGTLSHMPPELLQYGRVSTAVDCFSFGVVMAHLLTGVRPWGDCHFGQLFQAIVVAGQRPHVPEATPEDYKLLMRACWAQDASERPNITAILNCLEMMLAVRSEALAAAQAAEEQRQKQLESLVGEF